MGIKPADVDLARFNGVTAVIRSVIYIELPR